MTTSTESKLKLTEADTYAMSRMPDGWFTADDVPPVVRCPYFRCERLRDRGLLEWRVTGEIPNLQSEWRKVKQ